MDALTTKINMRRGWKSAGALVKVDVQSADRSFQTREVTVIDEPAKTSLKQLARAVGQAVGMGLFSAPVNKSRVDY